MSVLNVVVIVTVFGLVHADLNWNSLATHLNTYKIELVEDLFGYYPESTTEEPDDLASQSTQTDLIMEVPVNLSSIVGPPLLSMFPGGQHAYIETDESEGDVGEPLILTPFIEKGKISQAREAARVTWPDLANIADSYSGFFTINKEYNSNLFFMHFPAKV